MNIYETISKVMSEISPIGKEKTNSQQGFKYRGIDDVMNELQPILSRNKLFIVPEIISHTREDRQSSKGNPLLYSICNMKYTFYAEDGTSISASVIGEAMDSADKATNKAMAVAFKYVCFQVFCIPTEEIKDPDGECHELVNMVKCDKCNTVIKDVKKDGKITPASDVHSSTGGLCLKCYRIKE